MATERYHPLFASDLAAACMYYDSIAEQLGNRFRENVRSIIQSVAERPESFGRIGGEFRGALVHRFPYVVVFSNDGGIPFRNTAFQNQLLLYVAAAILALIAIGLIALLLSRRSYLGAAGLSLAYLLCFPFLASFTQSRIIDPEQGNPEAEVHNDAAAIAAAAVDRFYARTHRWPRNWSELGDDIADVIGEVRLKHKEPKADPFSAAADPFSGDASTIEESQSIFGRAPDLRDLTPYELRNLVDINFSADPAELAGMNWVEFDGIVPHKPAYNMYRVEFGKLIARLNETPNTSDGSADTAK